MRVVLTNKAEHQYVCPVCKTLLAYTEDDVKSVTKFKSKEILEELTYIECMVCGASNNLEWKEYNIKEEFGVKD